MLPAAALLWLCVVGRAVLAKAFNEASVATGANIGAHDSVIMFGDWNEFEWADFQEPYKTDAQAR
jgi:hypothetical protein